MSLVNLSRAYQAMFDRSLASDFRERMAQIQVDEFAGLLAQWFVDSNEGAREWLREIALAHREAHPKEPPCAT